MGDPDGIPVFCLWPGHCYIWEMTQKMEALSHCLPNKYNNLKFLSEPLLKMKNNIFPKANAYLCNLPTLNVLNTIYFSS